MATMESESGVSASHSPTRIVYLANRISKSVARIQTFLTANQAASPSFDENATYSVPAALAQEYDIVLDDTAELHDLLSEPHELIKRQCGQNNPVCLRAIAEFNIAAKVPLNGQITFGELAKQTPVSERMISRLLRHAMTMRLFREPETGTVAHTAASKLLVSPAATESLLTLTKEMWPASTKFVDAIQQWPDSQEPGETAFSLSKNTTDSFYGVYAKDEQLSARLAGAMKTFAQKPQFDVTYIFDHFDWEALGRGLVVDVGGSQGNVGIHLARRFKDLNVLIQDLEKVVASAEVPVDLLGRVSFMPHDFLTEQPVHGADVYFLRLVLYNWSDAYCIRILQNLLPALKDGAKVIVQENLMPIPGTGPLWRERKSRAADIHAAILFNAVKRTAAELEELFRRVDGGFTLQEVISPPGSQLAMLVFTWQKMESGKSIR